MRQIVDRHLLQPDDVAEELFGNSGPVTVRIVQRDPEWQELCDTPRHVAMLWSKLNEAVTADVGSALSRRLSDWDGTFQPLNIVADDDEFIDDWDADSPYCWPPSRTGAGSTTPARRSSIPAPLAERLDRVLQRPTPRRTTQLVALDSLFEARVIIEDWRLDYNANRPHSAHGELTPNEFALQWTTTHQPQAA